MSIATRAYTRFTLPEDLVADSPPEDRGVSRDGVRLLVAGSGGVVHTSFRHLADHLDPGDLVVVNTSATTAAEIDAVTSGGEARVLHLAGQVSEDTWVVEVRTAPAGARAVLDHAVGDVLDLGGGVRLTLEAPSTDRAASPTARGNRLWNARSTEPALLPGHLAASGRPIAYGYLSRRVPLTAYQTIFARDPGSAEMPSAGRPFSPEVVIDLITRGVALAPILLHTGVSSQETGEPPQPEWFRVPASTAKLVNATRAAGGRVVAVGTTVTRALESAVADDGSAQGASGWTRLVLGPEHPPHLVTGLLTGWHDPAASHLALVESVAGSDLTQQAYDAAIEERYLWHEFGDSCLLLP